MTTLSNRFFDTVILYDTDAPTASLPVAAKSAQRPAPRMSSSLWRHTLDEHDGNRPHRRLVQGLFGGIAALGLGSVAYALWQTCALMSTGSLHDAVTAFLR